MKKYGIGIDMGIASVGWAAVALDGEENPRGIIDMGVRIFEEAEQPKTGASLAAPRREARSARRRLRRRRHRNERIRGAIVSMGLLSREQLNGLFSGQLSDIYELRVRALDEPVSREEFARILLHISRRRGFRSNRIGGADKEDGKLLKAISGNKARMEENAYRTVGEMLLKDPAFAGNKRNKGGQYISTVTRDMVEDEVRQIFAAQRRLGAGFAGEELEERYLDILLSQRSFDEGPGAGSPYGGSQIEKMVGKCTLEPDEPRAAKATWSFEYFKLLEKINHIRIIEDGKSERLTDEQRGKIIALGEKKDSVSFQLIRKELELPESCLFNMVRYSGSESIAEAEKKEKFPGMKACRSIRAAMERVEKGSYEKLSREQLNSIATVLTLYKNEKTATGELGKLGLSDAVMGELVGLNFSKFGHLSVAACDKLIPFLENGLNYNEACERAGYDFRAHSEGERRMYLPPLDKDCDEITSPVVKRAISQTIKVINAIIRQEGCSPSYVNLELARELSKTHDERKKIEDENKENRAANERIMQRLREEYHVSSPTGQDLIKLRLWQEQGGICAYSLRSISAERLFEPNYAEVDHIIPYSISFDDRRNNKVLVLAGENRDKGNRLPLQYLKGQRADDFTVWVKNSSLNYQKKQNLLKTKISDEDRKSFRERNLQDTKTMSVFMLNYVRDNLSFAPSDKGRKKFVTAVNGSVTAHLRKRWGINKQRENGDLHHAVDALVIACTTDALIQRVTRFSNYKETGFMRGEADPLFDPETGEVLEPDTVEDEKFPYPWRAFRHELEARLDPVNPSRLIADLRLPLYMEEDAPSVKPIFVSRMPKRKVTGAAHKETARSPAKEEGYVISKTPLEKLKLDKNGEIAGYDDESRLSDRLLYEALREQLKKHDGDGKKAFTEPFHKPRKDGSPGPIVKKVRIKEPSTFIPIQNGTAVAENDTMVRIDLFYVPGDGYYFVPIYVADTVKKELPNGAIVKNKPRKTMRDEDFVFSLYPNDLIKVEHKRGIKLSKTQKESTLPDSYETKAEMLYYRGANVSTGAISVINHDNTYAISSLGVKTLKSIEKYTVDVLGEYHAVKKEKRQGFENMRRD